MWAYGRNTVIEALRSNFKVSEVLLQEEIKKDEKIELIISLAKKKDVTVSFIQNKKISRITSNDEHQGVACSVDFKTTRLRDAIKDDNSFIYISEATYEHNIGAIIRTAECAGFAGVILPNSINITATIAKISTGALFHIPIVQQSIFQVIKELKNHSYNIIGIERGGTLLSESKISEKSLFIIGGEDKSLSETVSKECDQIISIPQFGKINSLNMSVASAIVIYEHIRQKIVNK